MKLPEEIIFSNGVPYGKVGNATQVKEIMKTSRIVFEAEVAKRYNNYNKMKEAIEFMSRVIDTQSKSIWLNSAQWAKYESAKQLLDSLK